MALSSAEWLFFKVAISSACLSTLACKSVKSFEVGDDSCDATSETWR